MAITSFNNNYSNRTVDINLFQVSSYTNNQTQTAYVGFGNPSQQITGIEKLVQRYAILFLTAVGSQINYPTFGTSFISAAFNQNVINSGIELQHYFNFANLTVTNIFLNYQSANANIPTDEQFANATLISYGVSPGTISMNIAITSVAGSSLAFVLPVPLT